MLSHLPLLRVGRALQACGWMETVPPSYRGAPAKCRDLAHKVAALSPVVFTLPPPAASAGSLDASATKSEDGVDDHALPAIVVLSMPRCSQQLDSIASDALHAIHIGAAVVISDQTEAPAWRNCTISRIANYYSSFSVTYQPCCFGDSDCAKVRIVTNIEYLSEMESQCHHIHAIPKHEAPVQSEGQAVGHSVRERSESASTLVDLACAIPITWWAAEVTMREHTVTATVAGEDCGVRARAGDDSWIECIPASEVVSRLQRADAKSRVTASAFWVQGELWRAQRELVAAQGIPEAVKVAWSQEDIARAIMKLFPPEWVQGAKAPFVEDIINSGTFGGYHRWVAERGDTASHRPPSFAPRVARGRHIAAGDRQGGAVTSKRAIDPLIAGDISMEQHFRCAMRIHEGSIMPWYNEAEIDDDLRYAAAETVAGLQHLRERRQATARTIQELARRCEDLSEHLKKFQAPSVASVAHNINVAFVAVVCLVTRWPDWRLPSRFVSGFRIVGVLERAAVFAPLPRAERQVTISGMIAGNISIREQVEAAHAHQDAEFLVQCCRDDQAKGSGGPLLTEAQVDEQFKAGQWTATPRFMITQSTGKRRAIDDGKRGGQNAATFDDEKLVLCTAVQPVHAARALREEASRAGVEDLVAADHLETGGEDMPDAYRGVPCAPEDLAYNIVAVKPPDSESVLYQVMYGLMFGYSSAVKNFNRWSKFLEAAARRIAGVLWSMYFDDGNIIDFASAKGEGQRLVQVLFACCGQPLSPPKRQRMAAQGDFLGLMHDMSGAIADGEIVFWPRPTLVKKASDIIAEAAANNWCTPATASKLRGIWSFMELGMFGRVGRGGQGALRQRQYTDARPWHLSYSLDRALHYMSVILNNVPKRVASVAVARRPPIIIATDAQADTHPTAGFLCADTESSLRVAGFVVISEQLLSALGFAPGWREESLNPIAQCEAAIILLTLTAVAPMLFERDVIVFVDNTVSLHSMVKGSSTNAAIDRTAHMAHILGLEQSCRLWFEFVPSEQNWADGVSRNGLQDKFVVDHYFKPVDVIVNPLLWTLPLLDAWQVLRHLLQAWPASRKHWV